MQHARRPWHGLQILAFAMGFLLCAIGVKDFGSAARAKFVSQISNVAKIASHIRHMIVSLYGIALRRLHFILQQSDVVGNPEPLPCFYCRVSGLSLVANPAVQALFSISWIGARRLGDADGLPHHAAARGLRVDQARQHFVGGRGTAELVGARSCERDSHIAEKVRQEALRLTPDIGAHFDVLAMRTQVAFQPPTRPW
jgi:hypothetical protein